jgi:hypothetical protein
MPRLIVPFESLLQCSFSALPRPVIRTDCYRVDTVSDFATHVLLLHRWDKPDAHIVEAMESRLKDIDLAAERNLRVRYNTQETALQTVRQKDDLWSPLTDPHFGVFCKAPRI